MKDKTKEDMKKTAENAKKKAKDIKEKAEDHIESAKENIEDAAKSGSDPKFWDDVQDNISEGAKVLNEEAIEFAGKVSAYSERIFGVIKEKASDALNYGTNLTRDAVNYAQELSEKYRDQVEIRKLNEEKKTAASQLGMSIYLAYKNNDNRVPVQTFSQKKIKSLFKELEELDGKILEHSAEEENKDSKG